MMFEFIRIAGLISAEKSGQTEYVEIRILQILIRAFDDADERAIRSIDARTLRFPLLQENVRIGIRQCKRTTLQKSEVPCELRDDTNLVPILQIRAHAREIGN